MQVARNAGLEINRVKALATDAAEALKRRDESVFHTCTLTP